MKIAQLTYLYEPSIGGVESHVKNLSEQLVKKGHVVDVITSDFYALDGLKRIETKKEIINRVSVHRLSGKVSKRKNFNAQNVEMEGLSEFLSTNKYDIVHCHSIPSRHFEAAYKEYSNTSTKIFATPHFSPDDLVRTFKTRLTPWYWRLSVIPKLKKINKIFSVSPSEKGEFIRLTGISAEKFVVAPNAVNLYEMDSILASESEGFKAKYDIKGKMVLFIGRIVHTKGIDLLVKAVAKIGVEDITLVIIGPVSDKNYMEKLESIVRSYGLTKQVRFMQVSRKEVLTAFHACDVFVLPTRGEVFGIVLAEAMACSKVVVATNVGGVPDLVKHEQNGLLFELENVEDLSRQILHALRDDENIQRIRNQARKTIEQSYDWNTIVDQIESTYNS